MQKKAHFKTRGMQRDLTESAFNPEFAFENMNIRIMATDDNTTLSITNEKGNKEVMLQGETELKGIPIGYSVLNNNLVIFTCKSNSLDLDRIYLIVYENLNLVNKLLYEGDLNFNTDYPIETIPFYENEDIQKIYWLDGLNQTRFINFKSSNEILSKWKNINNPFDFVTELNLKEDITISNSETGSGMFSPGVIQYAFTYYNNYGQQSNIFYTSSLYYTTYIDRGGSPEDKVSNSFDIRINNVDTNFDFLRIYSIHRTSLDSTPTVKQVVDLSIPPSSVSYGLYKISCNPSDIYVYFNNETKKLSDVYTLNENNWLIRTEDFIKIVLPDNTTIYSKNQTSSNIGIFFKETTSECLFFDTTITSIININYTDNGITGSLVDPTELLYLGGESVVFNTMSYKDNTLFLGSPTLQRDLISDNVKNELQNIDVTFIANKKLESTEPTGYYSYKHNLVNSSNSFTTFKYLETYRFGLQFQHITGKWSEPIFIKDKRNTQRILGNYVNQNDISLITAEMTLNDLDVVTELKDQNYIKVRPVIVYPTNSDKECICQGVLCPTVYNVRDRVDNSPFAQSSWFTRSNLPFDIEKAYYYQEITGTGLYGIDAVDRDIPEIGTSENSRVGVVQNDYIVDKNLVDGSIVFDTVNKGSWSEFRHNKSLPINTERNCEIQCMQIYGDAMISTTYDKTKFASVNSENFHVDQSILTFHSPELEFDDSVQNLDMSNLKLRIVGIVPLSANISDIDISTSTSPNVYKGTTTVAPGFYKEGIGVTNISRFGCKGLNSAAFWFDEITGLEASNPTNLTTGFVVYPWHRNGSLNNTSDVDSGGSKSALLDKKKMSNSRYSFNSFYFPDTSVWNAYINNSDTRTGISDIQLFNSEEKTLLRLKAPENSDLNDINYYGNVDKVITPPAIASSTSGFVTNKALGYPIVITNYRSTQAYSHQLFIDNYRKLDGSLTTQVLSTDPIRMKYKSSPHAVIALNYTKDRQQNVLPTLQDGDYDYDLWNINSVNSTIPTQYKLFWEEKHYTNGVYQDVINYNFTYNNGDGNPRYTRSYGPEYGWLWLAELYNDNITTETRFGGITQEALENNQWLPCGESINLENNIVIKWNEGDTYYQRYDHLKTYPYTLEDQNSITDVISFMCETRINIDGRYDRNRGQISNLALTPTNFNLLNSVYNQKNNFFNYRTINSNRLNLNNFPTTITWTKEKTLGELIDSWSNITLASTLDLDGDKGEVTAIRRFNNELFSFQSKGIANILFNSRTQIAPTEGVPIEIANSGKVDGKRYIINNVGCTNKHSICETPNGLYFIDSINKGIYLFNGNVNNLSGSKGFQSWINSKDYLLNKWKPNNINNIATYYDKFNKDVLFISKDECLAYSELLGEFTSFYNYENTPYIINLENVTIAIKDDDINYKLWLQNQGDYNMYYNKYYPFYTTVIVNPDRTSDKTFNNVEFRSDTWDKDNTLLNTTFDKLYAWNEYQYGVNDLTRIYGKPSSLKKKFRMWRANIPRDIVNKRDRIRNPWSYIKLSMEKENINKTVLHDMTVYYFE